MKREEFKRFLEKASLKDLAKVLRRLAILTQTKVYLLWRNHAFRVSSPTTASYLNMKVLEFIFGKYAGD